MVKVFQKNEHAFSSTLDAIFFLILISISAVILFPNIVAEDQYRTASYISTQEMEEQLLSSILSGKVNEFEYMFKPAELASYNLSLPNNSMMRNVEETLYQKEQKHRTFADILTESLVLGLELRNNGSFIPLNPMNSDHKVKTKSTVEAYLEREIAGRYNYRLEARWYPVNDYIGNEIIIGDVAPENAIRQSTKISLPLEMRSTRDSVFDSMNDSVFQNALISSDPEYELHEGFNNSIKVASTCAAETVTGIVFPTDYLQTLANANIGINDEQLSIITSPEQNIMSPEFLLALQMINYTANEVYGLNITIPKPEENIDINLVDIIETEISNHNQVKIASFVNDKMEDEIDQSITMILSENDSVERLELRDQQLESICKNYETGGADIVLFLW